MKPVKVIKNQSWQTVEIGGIPTAIPQHWSVTPLGRVIEPKAKSTLKASDGAKVGTFPFFNCSQTQSRWSNEALTEGETLLVTTGGDYCFTHYRRGACAYSTDVWALNVVRANPQFIHFKLQSAYAALQRCFVGFKFKHLNKKDFRALEVAIPTDAEQGPIVAVLSQQEAVVADMQTLVSKLETRLRYFSEELLSGRLRVGATEGGGQFYKNFDFKTVSANGTTEVIPADWSMHSVNEIATLVNGYPFSKADFSSNQSGTPIIRIRDLITQTPDFRYSGPQSEKAPLIVRGDLLVSMDGDFVIKEWEGSAALLNQRLLKVVLRNNRSATFFRHKLQAALNVIHKNTSATTVKHLSSVGLASTQLAVPPAAEAERISDVFSTLEHELDAYKKLLGLEQKRFSWLLDSLMTGKYLLTQE